MRRNIADTRSSAQARSTVHVEPGSWVIVAEDDAAFRFLLGEALRTEGLEVLSAANGSEALELYRKYAEKVTLAIVDVIMPVMDGLTTATEMRKIDDNVFFLFISGYEHARLKEIGIDMEGIPNADFLGKPFTFKDMMSRIRMLGLLHQT
jgi:DNA-binding response OmpR family regulator